MRVVATMVGLLAVLFSGASAEEIVCSASMRARDTGAIEWVQRGDGYELRGARMVARDRDWEMDDALSAGGVVHAACPTCRDDQILDAFLAFALGPNNFSTRDLERKVGPEAVGASMRFLPFGLADAEFSARSDAVAASMGEFVGRARVIGIKGRNQSGEVIALAVAKGCLSVYGVLAGKDRKVGLDQLDAFVQAIGVDFYKPAPISVAPLTGLPLGDRFRSEDWEKR